MEGIARRCTDYILKKGVITTESYEIYAYGFQSGIEMVLCMAVSLLTAIYIHMVPEYLVFFLVFVLVRSFAGGLHLSHFWSCFICSYMVQMGTLLISAYVPISGNIALGITVVMSAVIVKIAPVESTQRDLDKEELRYFKAKLTKIILLVFLSTCILSFLRLTAITTIIAYTLVVIVISMGAGKIKYMITKGE